MKLKGTEKNDRVLNEKERALDEDERALNENERELNENESGELRKTERCSALSFWPEH